MPARAKAEGGLDYIRIKFGLQPVLMIARHIKTEEEGGVGGEIQKDTY